MGHASTPVRRRHEPKAAQIRDSANARRGPSAPSLTISETAQMLKFPSVPESACHGRTSRSETRREEEEKSWAISGKRVVRAMHGKSAFEFDLNSDFSNEDSRS